MDSHFFPKNYRTVLLRGSLCGFHVLEKNYSLRPEVAIAIVMVESAKNHIPGRAVTVAMPLVFAANTKSATINTSSIDHFAMTPAHFDNFR